MLYKFLIEYEKTILKDTERRSLQLAGVHPSSVQLKKGLPIFYKQLLEVLRIEKSKKRRQVPDEQRMTLEADNEDETALATASGRPADAAVAKAAGKHGKELLRLGYTLSHVVHAYGAMCQSITELASIKAVHITPNEFHDLNRCLDVAIAGAVTEFQLLRNTQERSREVLHLGFLAHELRNTLLGINISFELIKNGTVGVGGSTGRVLEAGLKQLEQLIDRSLTEVRLQIAPSLVVESIKLLHIIDQIALTADVVAKNKNQILEIQIAPELTFKGDRQLIYSALSNLIQNALKFTPENGKIEIRGKLAKKQIVIEVEDQCGGLSATSEKNLFKPYVQRDNNRKGLGIGLSIAKKAITLNHGTISVRNLPNKGCVFTVTLPAK